jgi:hypothetical protein
MALASQALVKTGSRVPPNYNKHQEFPAASSNEVRSYYYKNRFIVPAGKSFIVRVAPTDTISMTQKINGL